MYAREARWDVILNLLERCHESTAVNLHFYVDWGGLAPPPEPAPTESVQRAIELSFSPRAFRLRDDNCTWHGIRQRLESCLCAREARWNAIL